MNWTTPEDIRRQLRQWWDKGLVLSAMIDGAVVFPKRLVLKAPSASEMADRFDEVRNWNKNLRNMNHIRLETREFRHRTLGNNTLPSEAWIDSLDDAVTMLGKKKEAGIFKDILSLMTARQPALIDWLARYPLRALEIKEAWPRLLDVADWLIAHPRPGIYLRQLDLPGVHTKFIETHRGVLTELLDRLLPADIINAEATGIGSFTERYGFRSKPERIRFRMLDPRLGLPAGLENADMTLDAESFSRLKTDVLHVFITENETNYLAFPDVRDGMAVFGAGYGFDALGRAEWLNKCRILYWGDIDTHGFAILDEFRKHFGNTGSFLMDKATLDAYKPYWGKEDKPSRRNLSRLTQPEAELYSLLCDDSGLPNLRLEQERIGYHSVLEALKNMGFEVLL